MKKIKLAYFGSPDFAAQLLEKLMTDTTINQLIVVSLIVTQPDQKVGRKQILTPTPVKVIANKYKIKMIDSTLTNPSAVFQSVDLALVYAYGDLIPKELLDVPKYGFWNVHPSLLPKYRGPAPIATPLINGDKTTGVTIIKMDEEIDHGPIIAQKNLTIENNHKRTDLEKLLTNLSFEILKELFRTFEENINKPFTKQDDKNATYTNKLAKQDGFIEFEKFKIKIEKSPEQLFNLFRGLYPWPGIWTILPNGKRLKITDIDFVGNKLIIRKVQLESKNEVDFKTFNKAYNML
jgi:methionyl-tRNA formyltransferase